MTDFPAIFELLCGLAAMSSTALFLSTLVGVACLVMFRKVDKLHARSDD